MTCCEGWTSFNGFSLLTLLLLGVVLNAIPLIVNIVDEGQYFQNPISCFEWWFPGIIGAGLMVFPATAMSLAARKRGCWNSKTGMFLSSLWNVITVIGATYCVLVSLRALSEGPLICNSPSNSNSSCQFSFEHLSDIHPESFDLQWFFNESCVPNDFHYPPMSNDTTANDLGKSSLHFSSQENRDKTIHFSVFLGLLLVGLLELFCGLTQIVIGFLGCLCGVSKRRSRIV